MGTIALIAGIAAQLFGWFQDYIYTKKAIALGIREKHRLFRNKDGTLNVTKAVFLGFGIEYGIAIGAYFFTEALKNPEQSSNAGWYAFACVLISFGFVHFIYSLKSRKAIRYAKTGR